MSEKDISFVDKYLCNIPHIWCPGCGNGIVLGALLRSIDQLKIKQTQVAIVTGIGCSGRAGFYINFCTFQPPHGRALAFATGVKLGNPGLHVIVLAGDGDTLSIGGNHFIHSCLRNIDVTLVMFNNLNYGMTGGQRAPSTPLNYKTTTTPYGNKERNFDVTELARASGATYIARGTICQPKQLTNLIAGGIKHKGFSVIEAMSICPTLFGRINKLGGSIKMMEHLKKNSLSQKKVDGLKPAEIEGKYVTGELYANNNTPEFSEIMKQLITEARQRRGH